MSAKTIEEMRSELEVAGYEIFIEESYSGYLGYKVNAPDEWQYDGKDVTNKFYSSSAVPEEEGERDAIEKAWQHYQREKQHEAMRGLLEQMVNGYVWNDVDYDRNPEGNLQQWLHTAARLLKGEID